MSAFRMGSAGSAGTLTERCRTAHGCSRRDRCTRKRTPLLSPSSGSAASESGAAAAALPFRRVSSETAPIAPEARPLDRGDGWKVAALEEVGIDAAALRSLVEKIRTSDPPDSRLNFQSLLIARHGRLVFETYFDGFFADRPHDLRSAGKTWRRFSPVSRMIVGCRSRPKRSSRRCSGRCCRPRPWMRANGRSPSTI